MTNTVGQMEGVGNIGSTCEFTGRSNSAFMAGMAWYANAYDLRPDLPGKVRASTYWIDVLEAQSLEGMSRNQFALAAKYGGARLPMNFDPVAWGSQSLPESWWHSNNTSLTPFGSRGSGQATFKRPDNFFIAGRAADMVESLKQAFQAISVEVSSASAAAAASSIVLRTDTRIFVAGFRSEDWSGYVAGLSIDGGLIQPRGCQTCWEAEASLRQQALSGQRKIFTRSVQSSNPSGAGNGVVLDWFNLSEDQQAALNLGASGEVDELGADRVAWLRGQAVSGLRSRASPDGLRLLGAVMNASPVYFEGVVYVGSNGGMLHAFDAETGQELFAYVPAALLLPEGDASHAPVVRLTDPAFITDPRHFVDGQLHLRRYKINQEWRTILVASLGAGGRSVFALDVTNPAGFDASKVMWEFSHPDLGEGTGELSVARLPDEDWGVFVGNAYNSADHEARLLVIGLESGMLLHNLGTGAGSEIQPNGLAAPLVTDWPGRTGRAHRVYAGDLLGNMWVFDLVNGSTRLLFEARDASDQAQPITSRPAAQVLDNESLILSFGTGSLLFKHDRTSTQIQSLYGVFDTVTPALLPIERSELLQQSILAQMQVTTYQGERLARVLTDHVLDVSIHKGWYLDLTTEPGERVVFAPETLGTEQKRVRFSTTILDPDPCTGGRRGFFMDFNLLTGGRQLKPVFDLDGDGQFDDADKVDIDDVLVSVSGLAMSGGRIVTLYRFPDEMMIDPDGQDAGRVSAGPIPYGRMGWQQLR